MFASFVSFAAAWREPKASMSFAVVFIALFLRSIESIESMESIESIVYSAISCPLLPRSQKETPGELMSVLVAFMQSVKTGVSKIKSEPRHWEQPPVHTTSSNQPARNT